MIKNELQYKLTKSSAENCEKRLHWLRENPGAQDQLDPENPRWEGKAEEDGLQSMIDELRDLREDESKSTRGRSMGATWT